ncbi:MAG: glycosyltransferase, partial [Opitutales bacterium]|nr:glycosyltransferase [Opitutales bacterium]
MHKLAIVVPIYNHAESFARFLPRLLALGIPVILSDDGSAEKDGLKKTAEKFGLIYVRGEKNRGKGAAFVRAAKRAGELGFTHIFQIDADGQHSLENFGEFLEMSKS